MEKVTGVGGVFFRADDPATLKRWYEEHLGVTITPTDNGQEPWRQDAGPTVFEPFSRDTDYFGRAEQMWMINFRVRSLDAMVAQLRASGIDVTVDQQSYPNGRFARLCDPEGNPIELWEPI
jgi:glyoxylase I family protein